VSNKVFPGFRHLVSISWAIGLFIAGFHERWNMGEQIKGQKKNSGSFGFLALFERGKRLLNGTINAFAKKSPVDYHNKP
jgi:hypothetical protein